MRCIPYKSEIIKGKLISIRWFYENQLHSFNDQPASTYINGDKIWYTEGKLNRREDKPAIIYWDGFKIWCIDGVIVKEQRADSSIAIYKKVVGVV